MNSYTMLVGVSYYIKAIFVFSITKKKRKKRKHLMQSLQGKKTLLSSIIRHPYAKIGLYISTLEPFRQNMVFQKVVATVADCSYMIEPCSSPVRINVKHTCNSQYHHNIRHNERRIKGSHIN